VNFVINTSAVIEIQADRNRLMPFWLRWKSFLNHIGAWSGHWLMSVRMQVRSLWLSFHWAVPMMG